jgi:hypothetical protein
MSLITVLTFVALDTTFLAVDRVRENELRGEIAASYQLVWAVNHGIRDEELQEKRRSLDDLGDLRNTLEMRIGDREEGQLEVEVRNIRGKRHGNLSLLLRGMLVG